jgi:3-mercaptopyruvate sulfurtransferase SseA
VSDDSRVILYSDASVLPTTRSYFTFDDLGTPDHAASLDSGLEKWLSEGRPLELEQECGDYQAIARAETEAEGHRTTNR